MATVNTCICTVRNIKTCMHDSTNTYTAQLVNKYTYVHKIHTDNYNYRHRCMLSQVICNCWLLPKVHGQHTLVKTPVDIC